MRGVDQRVKGRIAAQDRIDPVKIMGVIAVVGGALKDRVEIQRVDPQILEIVQLFDDPQQIAALEPIVGGFGGPWLQIGWLGHLC